MKIFALSAVAALFSLVINVSAFADSYFDRFEDVDKFSVSDEQKKDIIKAIVEIGKNDEKEASAIVESQKNFIDLLMRRNETIQQIADKISRFAAYKERARQHAAKTR